MEQQTIVIVAPKLDQPMLEACFGSLGFSVESHERCVKAGRLPRLGLVVTTRTWLDRSTDEAHRDLEKYCVAGKSSLLVIGDPGAERFSMAVEYLPQGFDLLALHQVLGGCCKGYSRKHMRLVTRLPGVISRGDGSHICEIVNLSAGGAFVKTGTPISTNGGVVTLHVPLLGLKRELELGSQVVFQVVPNEQNNFQQGAGLRFAEADERAAEELQAFLAHLHGRQMEQTDAVASTLAVGGKRPRGGGRERLLTIYG